MYICTLHPLVDSKHLVVSHDTVMIVCHPNHIGVIMATHSTLEWKSTGIMQYGPRGGRDVLLIVSDLPLPDPEAVARRSGQLTEEDREKLENQGITCNCEEDWSISRERYRLMKDSSIVGIEKNKSGNPLCRKVAMKAIERLLNNTDNDGGKPHTLTPIVSHGRPSYPE